MDVTTDRLLYLDAPTGLAGDMLLCALTDAGADQETILRQLRTLPLDNWSAQFHETQQHGLRARQLEVEVSGEQPHRHLADILALIEAAHFPPRAETIAVTAFRELAAAEAQVHGCDVAKVHFHEVGAVDSIVDLCGCALALDALGVRDCYVSQLPLSSGTVTCAHGVLPVPAPAAAALLRGFQLTPVPLTGELITPTGAALLRAMECRQTPPPPFTVLATGYGAGHRQLPQPNLLRAWVGVAAADGEGRDEVEVLTVNIDDDSGEMLSVLWEKAFAAGARDLAFTPLLMKKGRPAWQAQIIVPAGQGEAMAALLLRETGALGCRLRREGRVLAPRQTRQVATVYGAIAVVCSGTTLAPEAEAVKAAAAAHGVTFREVYQAALAAAWQQTAGGQQ